MRITTKQHYSILIRPLLWLQTRHFGKPLNPALLWGRRPFLFYLVASFFGYLDRKRSPVSDVIRSLVCVRVSQLNDCAFCIDANGMRLAQRCKSVEKVQSLPDWQQSPLFDTQEKAVLAYTEAMTVTGMKVTSAMIDDLKQWYDEDAIVELTALVSFQNLSAKFNTALDVPSQAFCTIPLTKDHKHTEQKQEPSNGNANQQQRR
ncbi:MULTISPECIES: carboxymuconolactone decarboxylase family protein [Photobacterium]|uniref:carboxymuconolactone decarboxylase family protein n=1 Tax=Photobacterium TaxID=657 RepID=UPI001C46990A|nr:carboxymuconolactone decarboxylase family protein [Photobacterium arenosum]MBV7262458.1 carboxymuconolactone decarboxylase family protein [Photobacterium sp. WH24]